MSNKIKSGMKYKCCRECCRKKFNLYLIFFNIYFLALFLTRHFCVKQYYYYVAQYNVQENPKTNDYSYGHRITREHTKVGTQADPVARSLNYSRGDFSFRLITLS